MGTRAIIKALKNNEIVGIPTDTIFGLFVKVGKDNGPRLNQIKGRDLKQPVQIMFPSIEQAFKASEISDFTKSILQAELPGKKCFIVQSDKNFRYKNLLDYEAMAIRVPSKYENKKLIKILTAVGPCFATSANKHQEPILTNWKLVKKTFNIETLRGKSSSLTHSTIIKLLNDEVEIIRKGEQ
ncbi:MAG: hypothetical protein GQ557_02075 [Mycoplasmataceae bacterium]|nr:hypothetical protein [Mycoplasmataceae bacterium]